ncbi:MAG: molybdate ABC transporter permease subunit [Gaiellaceae bacterium]
MMKRAPVFAAALVGLTFLALPIAAIFARLSFAGISSSVVTDALVVSLKTTFVAQALVLAVGTPTAYVLASHRFRGRSLVITLVELPIVLPPAVAGIGLLATFGRFGLLHTGLPFTQAAVVVAVAFVSGPLYVRQAIAAFEGVDETLVAASRTLGAGPTKTFFRVIVPLARGGLGAGEALAFARGLGEFGATIMFAGSLQGVTQTLPLAVYAEFAVDFHTAVALGGLLVLVSAVLLVTLKWLASSSTSAFRFAPSTSS